MNEPVCLICEKAKLDHRRGVQWIDNIPACPECVAKVEAIRRSKAIAKIRAEIMDAHGGGQRRNSKREG
jgi:hypothetical protein